jgi:hypothetical protein
MGGVILKQVFKPILQGFETKTESKQALYLGYRQPRGFESFINNIIGIVFLGTPHGGLLSDQETCSRCVLIMKTFSKSYQKQKQMLNLDADEIFKICNVAVQFDQIALDFPILSVYDGQETKIGQKLFIIRSGKVCLRIIFTLRVIFKG